MDPAPRPHRPRPAPPAGTGTVRRSGGARPLPGVQRAAGAQRPACVQPIRVPSLLATLRRGATVDSAGVVVRGASVGAIAIGATLFVVASLATPLVSANVADKPRPSASTKSQPSAPVAIVPPALAAPVVGVDQRPQAPQKAPADPGAISKLAANGIPKVALNAYRVAAARVNHSEAACGIDWSLLAGIGRAESDHGRFAGSKLRADGTSTPPIVGPALTGKQWEYFAASAEYIAVTGDSKYAHALGPMQFIPSTWRGYGADANGDGKTDIFNVNDAALAAARYLCTAGGDLTSRAGQVRAVLAYNHNDQYLAQVLALADAYKRGVPISGIPVGNITGTLPSIGQTGDLPPVNPGAPTAADKNTLDRAKKKSAPTPSKTASKPGTGAGGSGSASRSSGAGSSGSGSAGSGGRTTSAAPTSRAPSSPAPTSSAPSKMDCDPLKKAADNLLPPNKRVCN